ncbi:MAG: hypothetical protein ACOZDY_20760 [Pseudomonadota bacterium]
MRIPVFVSVPTSLSPRQEDSRRIILDELDKYGLEERRLGASDYPTELPLLVFREDGIEGGVFDHGVADVFVHRMPTADMPASERKGLSAVFLKWQSKVRERYYG